MDVFELLKKDHRKVSQLFDEIESASGQAKKQTFQQLRTELDLHAQLEERLFYPRLEKTKSARDITLEAYEEHNVVKDLLAELANDGMGDEWDAKLKVLRENVDHHVEEEEGELFDKAEEELSDEETEQIGAQMEAEKERVLGSAATNGAGGSRRGSKKAGSTKGARKSSGGVLNRLANFVGLGDSSSQGARKTGQKGSSSKSSKKSGKKAASKSGAGKSSSSKGGASKSASKGSKSSGGRKAAGKGSSSNRGGGKKKSGGSKASSKGGAKKRGRKK